MLHVEIVLNKPIVESRVWAIDGRNTVGVGICIERLNTLLISHALQLLQRIVSLPGTILIHFQNGVMTNSVISQEINQSRLITQFMNNSGQDDRALITPEVFLPRKHVSRCRRHRHLSVFSGSISIVPYKRECIFRSRDFVLKDEFFEKRIIAQHVTTYEKDARERNQQKRYWFPSSQQHKN